MFRNYIKMRFLIASVFDFIISTVFLIIGIIKYLTQGFSGNAAIFFIAAIFGFIIGIILLFISRKGKEKK